MNIRSCPREAEVRELIKCGHWPDSCEPELRAHVESCEACAEAVQFAQIFQAARAASMQRAPMAAAGPIWWRAQLRRRNAAFERIAKPVRAAQIFAVVVCLLTMIGVFIVQRRSGNSWLTSVLHPSQLWLAGGWSLTVLISSVATLSVLGAVVLFLAAEADESSPQ